jgi:hypothetical protein
LKGFILDSSESAGLPAVPLQSRREQTIAALCEHFSKDNLTLEEFEHRLDAAHRVQTMPELNSLLQDLPAITTPVAPAAATSTSKIQRVSSHAREQQHLVAIMGGVDKRGQWQPAQKTFCYALMGGVQLDFREAILPPGETEVTIIAVMGGAEIVVPPEVRVDSDGGIAIMGGFDHRHENRTYDPNAPVLKINGFCLMGGVEITVRQAGESAGDARRRRREEKRFKRG